MFFTPDDAAVLLIDHQVGTIGWVGSADHDELRANTVRLARTVKALGLPVVLTSSMEDQVQGPLIPELEQTLPAEYAARIQRTGAVNAMADPDFATAVENTGRRRLIVAGVTTDVCVVFPVLSALEDGYQVQVVVDAGGSLSPASDEMALRRMERAGAVLTTTRPLLAELAGNWASPAGQAVLRVDAELHAARR
ncbi:isochorismatase family protein [Streptomyces sp. NPDC052299]|uniref:isochorismatase family protein n=1 Tax=Streptomyces sp. NPDC052299 TaxID=3155054 RepID=UPI003443D7BD